jgi:hypothetical protein
MAAMITLAEPSIAWATGLDGLLSWLAIWAWDRLPPAGHGIASEWRHSRTRIAGLAALM